jgi:predicted nuclease with TOPRIM domain
MNRIAKVWEELDKKNGRHANLSKAGKRKNVKLAKVSDFEQFEKESDQLFNDLEKYRDDIDNLKDIEMSTVLSDAEQMLDLNEEWKANYDEAYDSLSDQFDELGMDIESMPIAKMHEEFNLAYEGNQEDIKKYAYEALEHFENQIRAIIGSK